MKTIYLASSLTYRQLFSIRSWSTPGREVHELSNSPRLVLTTPWPSAVPTQA